MPAYLSPEDEATVCEAIGGLEVAEGVVPATAFVALREPALRAAVEERLGACGRSLFAIGDGWVSGYRDDIADVLVGAGTGVLTAVDRAVLALVLLRTVAVPRARGELTGESWMSTADSRPTTVDELNKNRHLNKKQISESLRRLRTHGLIRPGHRSAIAPGPAMVRLSSQRATELWEDLLLLAAPESTYAQVIRSRRLSRAAATQARGRV